MTAQNYDANDVAIRFGLDAVRSAFELRDRPGADGFRLHSGQAYWKVGVRDHIRRDGTPTQLALWKSNCAVCGVPFEFWHPALATKFEPNRRCAAHKQPGQRLRVGK